MRVTVRNGVSAGRVDAMISHSRCFRRGLWVALWAMLAAWVCVGWCPAAQAADAGPAGDDTLQRIMTVQENLASINRRIEKEQWLATQGSASEQAARNRVVTRLQEIKFIQQRLLNTLKKNISLAAEETRLGKEIESGTAFVLTEQKPYALSYYDQLLDQAAAVQREQEVLGATIKGAEQKVEESRNELERAEQTWRRVKEAVGAQKGGAAENDLRYIQAQLEREGAQAALALQQERLAGFQGQMRLVDLKQQAAQQKLTIIRKDLSFDPAALDQEIQRLDKHKQQLNDRLQSILDAQKRVDLQWHDDGAAASVAAADSAMKAREAWRDAYETLLQQTEDATQLLNMQENLWRLRYNLVTGSPSARELDLWEQEAATDRQHTQQAIGVYQGWQVNLQSRIAALGRQEGLADSLAEKYAAYQLSALNKTAEAGGEYLSMLLATGQLADRLLDEIAARGRHLSLWERTLNIFSRFGDVWNFELWVIDENGVTVRKVVTALVILIIGLIVVKRAIKLLAARLQRARMQASAAAAVEKLLLYIGFVLVLLLALRTVNIPLTAFTFLGGAIAIGVGFGAQNLINNFISGFIIMAERPIRIGDLIELDGQYGRVEEIGARCTRVKTGENIHILVPNSSLLEKNIINWTLSDQMIRAQVTVGVAYGSPVQQVTQLLLQAADQTEHILKDPKPFVIFEDFGDNALTFVVYFWVIVSGVIEKRRIASDLRYQIDALFGAHNIVIAFPQRDIHLDTLRPLQVQLSTPQREHKA